MHFQHVTQDCPPLLLRYFIAMSSIEPARREETEHDKSARLILPRQVSSACCCILTRCASEGSASEPALRVGRYVRFESPLHAGLQAEGPVAGVSG